MEYMIMPTSDKIDWPIFSDNSEGESENIAEMVCFSFQKTLDLPEDGCCLVTTNDDKELLESFKSIQSDIVLQGASDHPFFPFGGRAVKLSNPPTNKNDLGGLHLDLGIRPTDETNRPEINGLFPLIVFATTLLEAGQKPITDVCFGPSLFPSDTNRDNQWVLDIIKNFKQTSLRRLTVVMPPDDKQLLRKSIESAIYGAFKGKLLERILETDSALNSCLKELKGNIDCRRNSSVWPDSVNKTLQEISASIPDFGEAPTTIITLSIHGRKLVEALALAVTPVEKRKLDVRSIKAIIDIAVNYSDDPKLTELISSYTYCLKNIGNDAAHIYGNNQRDWALPLVYCLLSLTSWMDVNPPRKECK